MPHVITTTRPCICTEADDPNDHRKSCPHWWGHDGVTNRAAGTLDEAKNAIAVIVTDLARDHHAGWQSAFALIVGLPEQGGTVGPLPDGTMINVEPATWKAISATLVGTVAGIRLGREHPQATDAEIIDAYNAAQVVA